MYLQVKIKLPTQLTEKHHVFFTFQHVACEQNKSTSGSASVRGKPVPVETPGMSIMSYKFRSRIVGDNRVCN